MFFLVLWYYICHPTGYFTKKQLNTIFKNRLNNEKPYIYTDVSHSYVRLVC